MKVNESIVTSTAQVTVKEVKTLHFYAQTYYAHHYHKEVPYTEDEAIKREIVKKFIKETKQGRTSGFGGYMYATFYVIRDVWITFEGANCHVIEHQTIRDNLFYVFDKENKKERVRPIVFQWKKAAKVLNISKYETLQTQQKANQGKGHFIVDVTDYAGTIKRIKENIQKIPTDYGITTSEKRSWLGGKRDTDTVIKKIIYSSSFVYTKP